MRSTCRWIVFSIILWHNIPTRWNEETSMLPPRKRRGSLIRCSSCHENWNTRAALKRYTTLSHGMECPSCGQMQYLSDRYRERSLMMMLLIPVLMLIPAFFNISIMAMSLLIFAALIVIASIHLFTTELVSEADIGHQSFY